MTEEAVIRIKANVHIQVIDAALNEVIQEQRIPNLVVNDGLNLIRDLLDGDSVSGLTHFGVGTGTNAVLATNTTLQTQVFRDAVIGRTSNAQQLIVSYYLGTGSANGSTLTEAGLFNAATGGTMFARVKFATSIVKTSSIAATFTWTINLAAS